MSDSNLLILSVIMIGTCVFVLSVGYLFFNTRQFDLAKVTGVKPGIYQNKITGRIVEVRRIKSNMAYVCDSNSAFNLDVYVIHKSYEYLGEL
jgi:hypothetical protein